MFWCKVSHFLISIFPFKFLQSFLIRSHIQKCERCRSHMASREEVKDLIILESDVEEYRDLWPAIKAGIAEKIPKKKVIFSINRRWGFAAASVAAVFLAGFLLFLILSQNGALLDQEGEARFQINSIRVGDEPATPFVYQPNDSDMILVWAEKNM
jgi:predicted anti-sigma-YlaC factor YlaD